MGASPLDEGPVLEGHDMKPVFLVVVGHVVIACGPVEEWMGWDKVSGVVCGPVSGSLPSWWV